MSAPNIEKVDQQRPGRQRLAKVGEYVAPLEGLRFYAAIGVVAVHSAIYSGDLAFGWNGVSKSSPIARVEQPFEVAVPFFCVMAGLLLYRQFANTAITGEKMQPIGPYLWRRVLRVLPLYWAVTLVAMIGLNTGNAHGFWDWARPFLFLQIYVTQKGQVAIPHGMTPTWSLASEAVFYLVLPPLAVGLAWLAAKFGRNVVGRARMAMIGIVGLMVINLGWVIYDHSSSLGWWPAQVYWLPQIIGYFAAGMGLAAFAARLQAAPERRSAVYEFIQRRSWVLWVVALAGFVALGVPAFVGADPNTINYPTIPHAIVQYLLNLLVGTLVVAAVVFGGGKLRILSNRVAAFGGRLSYGVYLWHAVVLTAVYDVWGHVGMNPYPVVFVVALIGAFGLSALTYFLVEVPARKLRPLLGKASTAFRISGALLTEAPKPEPVLATAEALPEQI